MPKKKLEPSLTWEEAPDTIGPTELAKILGIGIPSAREKFKEKNFPRIQGIGNSYLADKEVTRLYIQGVDIKSNTKDAINGLLLFEIKKLNSNISEMRVLSNE